MSAPLAFQTADVDFARAPHAGRELVARFRKSAPPPAAPEPAETLVILRGWKTLLLPLALAFPFLRDVSAHWGRADKTTLDWLFVAGGTLAIAAFLFGSVRFWRRPETRRFFVADRDGVTLYSPIKARLAWSEIAGCAVARGFAGPRLRLFVKPGVPIRGVTLFGKGRPIEIRFQAAQSPKRSLELAYAACLAGIGERAQPAEPPLRRRLARLALLVGMAALPLGFAVVKLRYHPLIEEPARPTDARPGFSVMFLGNSRIYGNDLPKMVRDIADSAGSPIRYDVHMRSWLAATFKELWNDRGDRDALTKPWGKVILQPESGAFWDADAANDTMTYGDKLIRAAKAGGSQVAVIANWTRGPTFFDGDAAQAEAASKKYGAYMAHETRALAELSGADVIDLEGAFAEAETRQPNVALTLNGNDPTAAGTYLSALVIYGFLSEAALDDVKWRPFGLSEAQAAEFKAIAARHYLRGGLRGSIDPEAPAR